MPDAPATMTVDVPTSAEADAHLSRLHKMSTTAGVTNTDYVAVNYTAIVALLLGIASAMAFFGRLLLVIPVVGVIFGVVAFRQIKNSGGTQTGRGLALLGLALSLGLGGWSITREAMAIAAVKDDEAKISATISQVGDFVKQRKYKEAYALFDDEFQSRVKLDAFQKQWEMTQAPTPLGPLQSMEWNGVTPYFGSAQGSPIAETKARMKFTHSSEERFDVQLRRVRNKWLISRFDVLFPERKVGKKSDDYEM